MRDLQNCSELGNVTIECFRLLVGMLNAANNDIWKEYRNSKENKMGADLYTVAILGLFASVIVCLLFRSVRRADTDDQVMLLLSSMQIHVDYEERERQRRKMREEKCRTQSFIADITLKSLRKFTRSRSASTNVKDRSSFSSVPSHRPLSPFAKSPYRTSSYQGYLPEIVVTDHQQSNNHIMVASSQPMTPLSRQSSVNSYQSPFESSVFIYPEEGEEFC